MTPLEALQKVRECKRMVLKAMGDHGGSAQLETIYYHLDELEQSFESAAVEEKMPAILVAREKLAEVAGDIKEDIADLREVAEKVADVAKAVKILTDIGKQAASLGV